MGSESLVAYVGIAILATSVAALIVVGLAWLIGILPGRNAPDTAGPGKTSFLFDGEDLVHATPDGLRLLQLRDPQLAEWDGLVALLAPRFPGLHDRLDQLLPGQACQLQADSFDGQVRLENADGLWRIDLQGVDDAQSPLDRLRLQSVQDELDILRGIADDAPQAIWKQDGGGNVVWANRAYIALADAAHPPTDGRRPGKTNWPLSPIFAEIAPPPDTPGQGAPTARRVRLNGQDTTWYDVTSVRRGDQTIHFALDAGPAIAAEHARRVFVQTLTKTFANLATGLAIFDRGRRLVMFNPSFLDLTGLPAGFLTDKPDVHAVLDRLRDINMLPEPKHYISWRERVTAVEIAAENGTYCENWALPSGQTYRVTGRPHPDGAIALLFEDISDEISLTRAFRAERDTMLAVLDTLEEAVAVFSANGVLKLSNRAYQVMWGDMGETMVDCSIEGEVFRWRDRAAPAPFWSEVLVFARNGGDMPPLLANVRLRDGRGVTARVMRLSGHGTFVGFQAAATRVSAPKKSVVMRPAPELTASMDINLPRRRASRAPN